MSAAESPIFVIGTGRSGTTLLQLMLCAHPRIHITCEAAFYVWEKSYLWRQPCREYLDWFFRTPSFRWLRLDPARVLAGLPDPLPRERLRDAYAAVMREKAADHGRVRFGDKTPSHAACLKRIFEDFPGAKVVHIIRDPRATAVSLARMPWACGSLYANAVTLELERRHVEPYKDRVVQLRLEDLLASPKETMARVLDFVGEPWDDRVLDHARHVPEGAVPPLPWLESSTRERAPRAPGADWAKLSPLEVRLIEHVTKPLMERWGYERAKLSREPSHAAVLWSGYRQWPVMVRHYAAYAWIGLKLRDAGYFDAPEMIEAFRRVNPDGYEAYRDGMDAWFRDAPKLEDIRQAAKERRPGAAPCARP
jgi:hypothetical protein